MEKRPVLGITMGDVCGIGPEITVKALQNKKTYEQCRPLVVGPAAMVRRAVRLLDAGLRVNEVADPSAARFVPGAIDVYDIPLDPACPEPPYGQVTAAGGRAAFLAVEKVIELAMAGKIDGTVTGPLNKEAMNLAGYRYSGHTEIYAEKTGTRNYAMMLAHGNLRVVHVSTHLPLREACDRVKKARVHEVIRLAQEACQSIGIPRPRIAVAGLNPHAGENALFGREELEEIIPAIRAAEAEGIQAAGPEPPDTVFSKALGGLYDIVVAMYHDQGHIPLKVVGFVYDKAAGRWQSVSGVNVTLGLPIVRASVDHGTAFDQAGKGTAAPDSLENAIHYGALLARRRLRPEG